MLNKDVLKRIEELNELYYFNWGKCVDYSLVPVGLSQEKLVDVLERIVETGESILVGYEKLKK